MGTKLKALSMWNAARLVVGLCQPGIRNNVLQALDLKRNRTLKLRSTFTGSDADTVIPKMRGSTQRKSPVIFSKVYLFSCYSDLNRFHTFQHYHTNTVSWICHLQNEGLKQWISVWNLTVIILNQRKVTKVKN